MKPYLLKHTNIVILSCMQAEILSKNWCTTTHLSTIFDLRLIFCHVASATEKLFLVARQMSIMHESAESNYFRFSHLTSDANCSSKECHRWNFSDYFHQKGCRISCLRSIRVVHLEKGFELQPQHKVIATVLFRQILKFSLINLL